MAGNEIKVYDESRVGILEDSAEHLILYINT